MVKLRPNLRPPYKPMRVNKVAQCIVVVGKDLGRVKMVAGCLIALHCDSPCSIFQREEFFGSMCFNKTKTGHASTAAMIIENAWLKERQEAESNVKRSINSIFPDTDSDEPVNFKPIIVVGSPNSTASLAGMIGALDEGPYELVVIDTTSGAEVHPLSKLMRNSEKIRNVHVLPSEVDWPSAILGQLCSLLGTFSKEALKSAILKTAGMSNVLPKGDRVAAQGLFTVAQAHP